MLFYAGQFAVSQVSFSFFEFQIQMVEYVAVQDETLEFESRQDFQEKLCIAEFRTKMNIRENQRIDLFLGHYYSFLLPLLPRQWLKEKSALFHRLDDDLLTFAITFHLQLSIFYSFVDGALPTD
jgi:hypothetical protein